MEEKENTQPLSQEQAFQKLVEMFAKSYRGGPDRARENPHEFLEFLFLSARNDPSSPHTTSDLLQWADPKFYSELFNR